MCKFIILLCHRLSSLIKGGNNAAYLYIIYVVVVTCLYTSNKVNANWFKCNFHSFVHTNFYDFINACTIFLSNFQIFGWALFCISTTKPTLVWLWWCQIVRFPYCSCKTALKSTKCGNAAKYCMLLFPHVLTFGWGCLPSFIWGELLGRPTSGLPSHCHAPAGTGPLSLLGLLIFWHHIKG